MNIQRLLVWIGLACISGSLYAGVSWLGHYYWDWSIWYIPLTFMVAFVGVIYAGSLCSARAKDDSFPE